MKDTALKIAVAGTLMGLLAFVPVTHAAKSTTSGAQFVKWNLSAAVMPVPPYGSQDIPGSDTASKLIVNQPNGKVLANMTGDMAGLHPNTEYTVYLSNVYTPAVFSGWSVQGLWNINMTCTSGCPAGPYLHDMNLSQSGTSLTANGGYIVSPGGSHQNTWSGSGSLTSTSTMHLSVTYTSGAPACTMDIDGTIANDGTLSGTWTDNCDGTRSGTWVSTLGHGTRNYSVTSGWPGMYGTLQPFTFMTDSTGAGSWHVNLKTGTVTLPLDMSVWVNGSGATLLISDSFHLGA